jgi:hypothetical protein
MRLARESHQRLEAFFREHLCDQELLLPPVYVYRGRVARRLTRWLRTGAITFGRRILFSPDWVSNEEGIQAVPGWLMAHEVMHVLQYEREGVLRFIFNYVRGFWRALRERGKWDSQARVAAYLAIAEERAALEVEHAYKSWSARLQP